MESRALVMSIVCAGSAAMAAHAQQYPTRAVRIVDGFPPGGGTDTLSRTLSQKMSEAWGQPVIVDNRPGASSNIGAQIAARANPDGHTVFMGLIGVLAPSMTLYPNLEYNLLKDLVPVSKVATGIYVVVAHAGLPAKSVKDLVGYAAKNDVRYASAGVASPAHLAGELFNLRAKVKMAHVPYKGGAAATAAIATGEVQIAFSSVPAALPLLQSGKARALAVTPVRTRALPDVPTIAESGLPGFELTLSYGLLAPAGTPKPIIQKINAETGRILKLPDVEARLSGLGLVPDPSTPEKFGALIKEEVALWGKVIREANIQVQ